MVDGVIELEAWRKKEDNNNNNRNVLEAMWWGLEHSVHSRDPNNPDPNAPGSIGLFMAKCADATLSGI